MDEQKPYLVWVKGETTSALFTAMGPETAVRMYVLHNLPDLSALESVTERRVELSLICAAVNGGHCGQYEVSIELTVRRTDLLTKVAASNDNRTDALGRPAR